MGHVLIVMINIQIATNVTKIGVLYANKPLPYMKITVADAKNSNIKMVISVLIVTRGAKTALKMDVFLAMESLL